MKCIGSGRTLKAVAVSLAVGLGMTACSRDYTVAYLYATSATRTTAGVINAYGIDFQSGALQQLEDSPIPSGGSNPVALVASPNALQLYVVNQNTSTVVELDIGTDGKLYPENTYNVVQGANGITGSLPTGAAIDAQGKFLYVTFLYQNGFTTARPGPGGVAVFPINSDGSLGSPVAGTGVSAGLPYTEVGFSPVGIVTSAYNNNVYVVEQDNTTTNGTTTNTGTIVAFTENTSSGALTQIPGPVQVQNSTGGVLTGITGFKAGTKPSAIAEDPSAHFVYTTDQATNQLYGNLVTAGGALQSLSTSPFTTGQFPLGLTIDPRGEYVYVANFGDNTLSVFAINTSNGSLSGSAGVGNTAVSTGPTCVTIEPALGIYLFTSNMTDNTVSAEQLNPHTGALTQVQGTPYTASALPTCAVAVPNGAHSTQFVTQQ